MSDKLTQKLSDKIWKQFVANIQYPCYIIRHTNNKIKLINKCNDKIRGNIVINIHHKKKINIDIYAVKFRNAKEFAFF